MKCIAGFIIILAASLAPGADRGDGVQQELKALQGAWKAVALEAGGKPLPKEAVPDFTYVIRADGTAAGKMPNSEYTATVTVDPGKNPRTIDNRHESGAQKGKTQYGIYKLEVDRLTVCMTRPGVPETDRPKDFATKDTAYVVFVFERVKENAKP